MIHIQNGTCIVADESMHLCTGQQRACPVCGNDMQQYATGNKEERNERKNQFWVCESEACGFCVPVLWTEALVAVLAKKRVQFLQSSVITES